MAQDFAAADVAPSSLAGMVEPGSAPAESAPGKVGAVASLAPSPAVQRQAEPTATPMTSVAAESLPVVRARSIAEMGVRPDAPVQREVAPVAAATPITYHPEPIDTPTPAPTLAGETTTPPLSVPMGTPAITTPSAMPTGMSESIPDVAPPSPVASSPVQRAVQPAAATSAPVEATDMPTMVMPTPTVAPVTELPAPVVPATHPAPPVQRTTEIPARAVLSAAEASVEAEPKSEGLEAVWPVQRVEAPKPKGDELSLDPVTVEEPMRHEKPEASQIQQVMRQVSAAKPSDSSVELILPRRQRPTPAPAPAPLRSIQTKPEANQDDGGGMNRPQAYVPTEIGPLPSDLWEILGAPTPGPVAPAGPIPQPANPAVMRAIAAAERPAPTVATPTQPVSTGTNGTRNGHAPAIQREETHSGQASGQSRPTNVVTVGSGLPAQTVQNQGGEASSGAGPAEQGEGEKPNVDELARQVYQEVRRRLAIEWERGRGQF